MELAGNKQVCDRVEWPEAEFVSDKVPNHRARFASTLLCPQLMPVMKALKRAFLLNIGEIVVPLELGDAGDPLFSERQVRDDAERGNNLGANAGDAWDFNLPACFS